ncbi:MAG: hypothetical protein ACHQ49_00125 [Elusimicrobiota bacterium]
MGPLSLVILALLLAVPPAPAQSTIDFTRAEASLDRDLDPYFAILFLKDDAAQRVGAAQDPDREAHLVERATALKDMSDILAAYVDPNAMNEAFRMRLGDDDANPNGPKLLGFGAHPRNLLAWRARYFNYVPSDRVETALWEWKTLSPEKRDWLSAAPLFLTEQKWEGASFARRFLALHDWAGAIYDRLMKSSPKTPGDLALMRGDLTRIWSVLDGAQKRLANEYSIKASAAVAGLQRLDKLPPNVRESGDPAIRDLLNKARSGATPLDTLAALSALFDKAGVKNPAVAMQAPDRPDQKFSSLDPGVFKKMLATGLLDEIGGVDEGRSIASFYRSDPLKVAVRDIGTDLAEFEPMEGALVFNERFVTDWIKSQGLSAQAVISDAARFHELVMILAPNFVHEATHQIQKAYADEHGIYAWNGQHQEIEAKEAQSNYMLAKMLKDPAYGEFLKRTRSSSFIVQQDLAQTAAFARDPRSFHAAVMSDYYAGLPSLDALETNQLLFLDSNIDALRAEKTRRAALPAAARAKLERTGFDHDEDFKTMAEWKAYLAKARSGVIEQVLFNDVHEREKVLKTYELAAAREEAECSRIEADMESLIRGDAPRKKEVPPPGSAP